jgi:competence protein ComGC
MFADHRSDGEVEGFTFVEIVLGLLVVGIFAAIAVFSVTTVTRRPPPPKPDQKCENEVSEVRLAVQAYQLKFKENPKNLDALVTAKIVQTVPSATSPSGGAGFKYDPDTGEYAGGSCLEH